MIKGIGLIPLNIFSYIFPSYKSILISSNFDILFKDVLILCSIYFAIFIKIFFFSKLVKSTFIISLLVLQILIIISTDK